MSDRFEPRYTASIRVMLGLLAPVALIALIIGADIWEGPHTAFIGVIASLPLMAAIFSGPGITAAVSAAALLGAYLHGLTAVDGNNEAQLIRLGFILLSGSLAVIYSYVRVRQHRERIRFFHERIELQATSELARYDQLTSIHNRHGVLERLSEEDRWPRTVVLFDLDKLKDINDTHGHQAGDKVIRTIAERLQRSIAPGDIVGRWGGDEFIVIFPLSADKAEAVTQRVLHNITSQPVSINGIDRKVQASAGIASWEPTSTLEHSVSLADEALYRSKHAGGNTACVAETNLV